MSSIQRPLAIWLGLAVGAAGCGEDAAAPAGRGEVIGTRALGEASIAELRQVATDAEVELPSTLAFGVDIHRVVYGSVDHAGNPIEVSGALMLPRGGSRLPLASVQHGTVALRSNVASEEPTEVTEGIVGGIMASLGYLTFVPDYPGFGASLSRHAYMHAASNVPSVVDGLRAARRFADERGVTLSGQVFLTGYSEGGFVTLAAQEAIEAQADAEFELTAVAPMAGPYDLVGTAEAMFDAGEYDSTAYLAFLLSAYDRIYGWDRLDEMLAPSEADRVSGLFDGTKAWGEIEAALPDTFAELMLPAFVDRVRADQEPAFMAALEENTRLDWVPRAPINFIHGTDDEISAYQNAVTAQSELQANAGASVELTPIPDATHETAGPEAIAQALAWFETFLTR